MNKEHKIERTASFIIPMQNCKFDSDPWVIENPHFPIHVFFDDDQNFVFVFANFYFNGDSYECFKNRSECKIWLNTDHNYNYIGQWFDRNGESVFIDY